MTQDLAHSKHSIHVLLLLLTHDCGTEESARHRGQRAGDGLREVKRLRISPSPGADPTPPLTSPGPAAPSPAAGSRCSIPGGAKGSGHWRHWPRTWRGAAAGPSLPACQGSAPAGSPAPARLPRGRQARARRASGGRSTSASSLWVRCWARGRPRVAGWVGDPVGRAHPAPRRVPAGADSSLTDFCGPNCLKQGSAGSEPPHAAVGRRRGQTPGLGSAQSHPPPIPHRKTQFSSPRKR